MNVSTSINRASAEKIANRVLALKLMIATLKKEKLLQGDIESIERVVHERIRQLLRRKDTRVKVLSIIEGYRKDLMMFQAFQGVISVPRASDDTGATEGESTDKKPENIKIPDDIMATVTRKELIVLDILVKNLLRGGDGVELKDIDAASHSEKSKSRENRFGRTRMLIGFLNKKIQGWGHIVNKRKAGRSYYVLSLCR